MPVIATLEDLDSKALIEILTKPKNALTKQYGKLFEMEDVKLTFSEDALESIANKALERKTGARGLRAIMESMLLDTMFDLPSYKDVEEVIINKDVIDSKKEPLKIHVSKPEKKQKGKGKAV